MKKDTLHALILAIVWVLLAVSLFGTILNSARIAHLDSRLSSLESPTDYYDTTYYYNTIPDQTSLIALRAKHQHLLEPLQLTFEEIESGCDPTERNEISGATGILQITKVKVKELNRIQDEVEFTYDDRWDKSLSEMMFDFDMLLNNEYLFSDDPVATIERACRIWNGKHASPSYISRATNLYLDILNHQE